MAPWWSRLKCLQCNQPWGSSGNPPRTVCPFCGSTRVMVVEGPVLPKGYVEGMLG